ncbi:MAG: hypothetical protein V3S89_15805 [Desulfobacterales bacterium]
MPDRPEKDEPAPPEIKRGDEIQVAGNRAIVYGILYDMDSDPGPGGYQVGVVFLDGNRGMANRAEWSASDQSWRFLEREIPRDARPALDAFVQKLRFTLVK